jgi:hypothetical protein
MSLRRLILATAVAAALASSGAPVVHAGGVAAARHARSAADAHATPRAQRVETYRRWIVRRFGSPPSVGPLQPDNDRLNDLWRSLARRYGAGGRPELGTEIRV